jgi:hypothetical protein
VIRTNTLSPAKENHLATADLGSRKEARSAWALTERPACFEIEPRGVRSSAPIRIWVSDAAHHCVQLRIDLLFTMSDNLHRGDRRDQRDTNSSAWTSNGAGDFRPAFAQASAGNLRGSKAGLPNRSGLGREGWWSQTESNRRPPACKAGALPTELWPLAVSPLGKDGGPGKI